MLKACQYCGRVHPKGYVCPNRPQRDNRYSGDERIRKFRNSKAWQRRRQYVRERDRHMCRVCAAGYDGKPVRYEADVSVHHIEPLAEAWELRLDEDNLICLCSYHHELAEKGKIPRNYLKKLAISELFSPPD